MKRSIYRLISVFLIIIIVAGTLTACGSKKEGGYVIKGEFYNMLIKKFNYYPLESSEKEMEEADNYDIEAQTIVDWDLLPEKLAFKDLEKPITKEEAALACLNTLTIKKSGEKSKVKDADLCDYPQEMVDAVANGILIMENGYIDAKEKLTNEECTRMLNSTMIARTENVFDEDEGVVKYSDNCHVISADDLAELHEGEFVVEGYEEADASVNGTPEVVNLSNNGVTNVKINSLVYTPNAINNKEQLSKVKTKTFSVNMTQDFYEKRFKGCEIGQLVTYTGDFLGTYSNQTISPTLDYQSGKITKIDPFAGKLIEVIDWSKKNACPMGWTSLEPCVTVVLEAIEDEEKMANTEFTAVTRKITGIKFEQLEKKVAGYKITVKNNDTNTGVICTATKTFKIKQNKYGNWRDATASPKVTFTGTIDNICFTTDKLQNFFKKGGTAQLKVTCDTSEKVELESGGLRLTPDSNRNGKFWSNLTNSRLTDGMGAQSIKVAKAPYTIPNTGITIEIGVYLVVGVDGKISIEFCQDGNGFEIAKAKNGEVLVTRLGQDRVNAEVNINLDAELLAKISVKFILVKQDVLNGELAGGVNVKALMSLYYKKDGKPELASTGYGDAQEATEACKLDDKIDFCVDVTIATYIRGQVNKDNLVGKVADKFGYDISKWKFRFDQSEGSFIQMPTFHFHFENGSFVEMCSINHGEEEKHTGSDETFTLSMTKLILEEEGAGVVYIVDKPVSDKKIKKDNGIKVKSKNNKIAKVTYNKKNESIMVEAVAPGSTEIEVYVKKDKKSEKKYTQEFSVTVSKESQVVYIIPKNLSVN